ncbi:MAG: hypothetical protein HRT74_02200, partial [Flavobacteriales bacterium]|nr:hypothetical protein [Flavobacteriales bacterium]
MAQIERGGEPVSWNLDEALDSDLSINHLPFVNISELLEEDEMTVADRHIPYRFAVSQNVDFDLSTDGRWSNLSNGDRIWQIALRSEDAYSIAVSFSDLFLPKGAVMYLYSPDRSHVLGAFTSQNNKISGNFTTTHVPGDEVIVEYYEPFVVRDQGRIEIESIAHAYRNHFTQAPQECEINLGCDSEVSDDKVGSSVVKVMIGKGTRYVSGVLLNNTSYSGNPLVLTSYDALFDDPSQWVFHFNALDDHCSNASFLNASISGATLLESSNEHHFALVELSLKPLVEWDIQYAGWNKTGSTPQSVSSIHHPRGIVKQINESDLAPQIDMDEEIFWLVNQWTSGRNASGS